MSDLNSYLKNEGPFDGLIAFSQGAALAATFLVQNFRKDPQQKSISSSFKCAIFLSGGVPVDPDALSRGELIPLRAAEVGEVIPIPTAHIWGENDEMFPGSSESLKDLCITSGRSQFIHKGGHEIPVAGTGDLTGTIHSIKRAIHCGQKHSI